MAAGGAEFLWCFGPCSCQQQALYKHLLDQGGSAGIMVSLLHAIFSLQAHCSWSKNFTCFLLKALHFWLSKKNKIEFPALWHLRRVKEKFTEHIGQASEPWIREQLPCPGGRFLSWVSQLQMPQSQLNPHHAVFAVLFLNRTVSLHHCVTL